MTDQATYFGANGWLLELAGRRILVDPWLVDSLVFPPGPSLFRGELPRPWPVPAKLDLLLLTQGLPDHCHPPTLALLDGDLPVVASAAGAARAGELGFRQVTALRPGQSTQLGGGALEIGVLEITAVPGAPVPQVENGYLLRGGGTSVYLEPHGYLAAEPQLPPPGRGRGDQPGGGSGPAAGRGLRARPKRAAGTPAPLPAPHRAGQHHRWSGDLLGRPQPRALAAGEPGRGQPTGGGAGAGLPPD